MDISTYQHLTGRTINKNLSPRELHENMIMGLMGEAGEIIDILKKVRYHHHPLGNHMEDIEKEIGDVLWYLSSLAALSGITLKPSLDIEYEESMDYFVFSKDLFSAVHALTGESGSLKEEIEDILGLLYIFIGSIGLSLEKILEKNISKLMKRYPEGFSSEASIKRKL